MIKIIALCAIFDFALSMHSSKALEGYPSGFFPNCPNIETDEPTILNSTLKHMTITTIGQGRTIDILSSIVNSSRYNYHQMKQLAKATDFRKPTLVYMIGYIDSTRLNLGAHSMGYYHMKLGYNIWLLDHYITNMQPFVISMRFLRPACKRFAEMLVELTKYGLNPKKLHLAGLSNGGQGVGLIAKHYRKLTGHKVSRVTALDPVGLCYRSLGPEYSLDKDDADFVDVLHTNTEGYGLVKPLGHVDFYVNGGEYQPSSFAFLLCGSSCSHIIVYIIWVLSVLHPKSFIALECDSIQQARNRDCYDRLPRVTNVLGLKTNKSRQGIFYLPASPFYPFYLAEKGLLEENEVLRSVMKHFNNVDVL